MGDPVTTEIARTKTIGLDNNISVETPTTDPLKAEPINALNKAEPAASAESKQEAGDVKLTTEEAATNKEAWQTIKSNSQKAKEKPYEYQWAVDGYTPEQKEKEVVKELPKGVTMDEVKSKGLTLKDLDRDLNRVKDKVTGQGLTLDKNLMFDSLNFMKKAGGVFDIDAIANSVKKAKVFGFDFEDGITDSSVFLGIIKGVLQESSKTNIWSYVEDTPLGDKFISWVIEEVLDIAAKAGSYVSVKAIIENYSGTITLEMRKKAVLNLFNNFKLKDEDIKVIDLTYDPFSNTNGYTKAAKNVVEHFDYIYPEWSTKIMPLYQEGAVHKHAAYIGGNEDILFLLVHHANSGTYGSVEENGADNRHINKSAIMQLNNKYKYEKLEDALAKANPEIVVE